MENAVMLSVLLAVVGVGLFGLYYANTQSAVSTIYVPHITGYGGFESPPSDVAIEAQVTIDNYNANNPSDYLNINVDGSDDAVNPTIFDSFGNCVGCDAVTVNAGPDDAAYGGGSSKSVCDIITQRSNVPVDISMRLNASLPSGWNYEKWTVIPTGTNTTPGNTDDSFARDEFANGTFYATGAMTATTSYQDVLSNWDDGTGVGNESNYSLACQWSYNPYIVTPGTYTLRRDVLGVEYVEPEV